MRGSMVTLHGIEYTSPYPTAVVALLGLWFVSCGDTTGGEPGSAAARTCAYQSAVWCGPSATHYGTSTRTHAHTFHVASARNLPGRSLSVAIGKLKSLALNAHFFLLRALSRLRRLGVLVTIVRGSDDTVSQEALELLKQRRILRN